MTTYLYEHPDHPSRVSRPEDADFAVGDPKWVRCYPVEAEVPVVLTTSPEKLWLVIGEDCPPDVRFQDLVEVLWCEDKIDNNSIGYVRQDIRQSVAECERLRSALKLAEAALADIGDADREPGDDLAWCEARAAQALPAVRAALTKEQHD